MNISDKSFQSLEYMLNIINNKPKLKVLSMDIKTSTLIIIDMVNGFVKEGNLSSKNVYNLNIKISKFLKFCYKINMKCIAFADSHKKTSPEFDSYPKHCIEGTYESEITDELKKICDFKIIKKNSTNGFIEPEFQKWLKENNTIRNFIIVGNCTDICIQQFALSLKSYFNMNNIKSRIIVPITLVDTFDSNVHNSDLANLMFLYNMGANGIEVCSDIEY